MADKDTIFKDQIFSKLYNLLIEDEYNRLILLQTNFLPATTISSFIENSFLPIMRRMWERLFILEMNFADRERLLQGETEAQRFEYFVRELCKQENLTMLCLKYPALWEKWLQALTIYRASLELLITRIIADIEQVAQYFYNDYSVSEVSRITTVGDPHKGMQQSVRVEFVNGTGQTRKVFYKPRNLSIDEGIYNFFVWWNSYFPINQIVPKVIVKDDYGWSEHIEHIECDTEHQVFLFYRRYGSLIALTHVFSSTDLHMENLISSSEFPVIVDIETLFSCTLTSRRSMPENYHIYRSLLLPTDLMSEQIEISPLSAKSNIKTDIDVLVNPQNRRSSLKMECRKFLTGTFNCQPIFKGDAVNFLSYEKELIEGARTTFLFLIENKEIFLYYLSKCMGNAPVRILNRATEDYVNVLQNIYHPDSLFYKEAERDILSLSGSHSDPDILEAEFSELRKGDVPYFFMRFNEPILFNANGQRLATPIFQSPRQKVVYQLSRITHAYIEQTLRDIEQSFLIYRARNKEPDLAKGPTYANLAELSVDTWFDELGRVVLNHLLDNAQYHEDNCYWNNIHVSDNGNIRLGLSQANLYDGFSGAALAFHVVGQRLSCSRFKNFADQLAKQALRHLSEAPVAKTGSYAGTSGTVWAICAIMNDQLLRLLPMVEQELSKISFQVLTGTWGKYEELDIVNGLSGTLMMLLRLHRLYYDYPISKKITSLSDFIFSIIKNKSKSLVNDETLLGFAHGTAGVSAALAEYMSYYSQRDAQAISIINNNIERETYYRTNEGWSTENAPNTSWCHGTVGFGYSRLHIRPYIPEKVYEADMRIVKSRLGDPQSSLCLCHGMIADYWLTRALDLDSTQILKKIRKETELYGITTNFGLTGFEMIGALSGMSGLFVGEALFLNKFYSGSN
ncbi:type 2 lanthipeptide synthetase LanM [Brucella sp. HL-2]|nr:type 2 lanthipeptide synthetase LanM [Brucella sp. HL-2]MCV9909220.1 type 2 lanthipeptide synthetase LanM [Brucella sp. HL-2]